MADDWTLEDARTTVTKARIEMRAENEATADRVMAWLDDAEPEVRRKFFVQYVEARRSDAAAGDYAETRLSEMRAQLEMLAERIESDADVTLGGPDLDGWNAATMRAANLIREVARG